MEDAFEARGFMVRDPVCAFWWQPISSVRRNMLANSFSFLPVSESLTGKPGWRLVSDFSIASYLRKARSRTDRNNRLVRHLGEAVECGNIELTEAPVCGPQDSIGSILELSNGLPVLVVEGDGSLRGIVTPLDVI